MLKQHPCTLVHKTQRVFGCSKHAMMEKRRNFIKSLASSSSGAAAVPESSKPADQSAGLGKSVVTPAAAQPIVERMPSPCQSSSSTPAASSSRKKFFSTLVLEEEEETSSKQKPDPEQTPEQVQPPSSREIPAVKFTLEGLLAFKDTAQAIEVGKAAKDVRERVRKRPNYNSSKRRLLAKMTDRIP